MGGGLRGVGAWVRGYVGTYLLEVPEYPRTAAANEDWGAVLIDKPAAAAVRLCIS